MSPRRILLLEDGCWHSRGILTARSLGLVHLAVDEFDNRLLCVRLPKGRLLLLSAQWRLKRKRFDPWIPDGGPGCGKPCRNAVRTTQWAEPRNWLIP